jgi:hypothetical protein
LHPERSFNPGGPTPGPSDPPPFDIGNPFALACIPAAMTTFVVQTDDAAQALACTFRCGPATMTVVLNRDDAKAWAAKLANDADRLSPLILGTIIPPMPNGRGI